MPDEDGLFTCNGPPQHICSICGTRSGPLRMEARPTGRNGVLYRWPYCQPCWTACQSNGHQIEPEVYLKFFRILYNHDLDRRICLGGRSR
jgi:hypothetical protein